MLEIYIEPYRICYNTSPNFADEEENKYYLNKVKERSQHINSLSNVARKLQIEQDKFNIINQENNRGKLQRYLDTQNKNINILTDKLQSDRNKVDLNVYLKPEPISNLIEQNVDSSVDGSVDSEEIVKQDTAKKVIELIKNTTLPRQKKDNLINKVIIYKSMNEEILLCDNKFNLYIENVLEDCPEYVLSGLVKKDLVSEVCYGCDI